METSISSLIEHYIKSASSDLHHRYHSWDYCRQAFSSVLLNEYNSLQLGFYLASWGMYRGSSGLLQKNHKIHEGPAKIYYSGRFDHLKCSSSLEITEIEIPAIVDLRDTIKTYYREIQFKRANNEFKSISATDTLMSKIILGTFGCVPAYDEFLIRGLKENGIKKRKFDDLGLKEVFYFYRQNQKEIETNSVLIQKRTGRHYPIMKIIDMYFWQLGYDLYLEDIKHRL
jgi:hypothetical protein